ncbi:AMP-binding protein [Rhodococcus sp. USK10]|uniref:AMP-binding protein n=1 Tax=Rhodococcus sp. USK10 TaxID=2789739 RepID=UPI0021516B4C|nr:AMP-binding protein [Rhodococcus sp. USK10]
MYAAEVASRTPDRVALIMNDTGEQRTYREFEDAANQVAHLLRSYGLEPADRVAVFMTNSLQMLEVEGGAERTGLYYTLVNSHLTSAEASWIINDCRARVVFTTSTIAEAAHQLPALCPGVEHWVMVDADAAPFVDYAEEIGSQPVSHVPDERLGLPMHYSSGTTGRPKGILRPMPVADPREPIPLMKQAESVYSMRDGMVFLQPAPLYHGGPHSHLTASLRMGGTAIVMEKFDAETFLATVEKYGVTNTAVVPTMFSRLLQLPDDVRAKYDVSSLEAVVHGAAPCPPGVKHQMIDWFGPILIENYGTTEAIGATNVDSHEWLQRPGTVGRPIFGELLILDGEGNEVPARTIGQIWWRGSTNFEYMNDAEKTRSTRRDGGRTSTCGDIGYVDEDGYLFVTDRIAFTIISGGVNIYPKEIEDVLVMHPAVGDVAVIGVPNDDFGEEVKAVIQVRPGVTPGPELERALIAFCREQLAGFKCPKSVDFLEDLPRLASGKMAKGKLRALYTSEPSSTSKG